jgi:hypothetical protein
MGLDLRIYLDRYQFTNLPAYGDSTFRWDRDYTLFGRIKSLDPRPADRPLQIYGDEQGLHEVTVDPYGDPLTVLPAGAFRHLWDLPVPVNPQDPDGDDVPSGRFPDTLSEWNRALLRFLCDIHPLYPVYLYWC